MVVCPKIYYSWWLRHPVERYASLLYFCKVLFIHSGWSRIPPLKRITTRKVCWWFQLIWEISTNQAIFPKREVNISKTYWKQASKKHLQVIGWLIQLKFTSEFGNSYEKKLYQKADEQRPPIFVSASALMEVTRSETKQKHWTCLLLRFLYC